jgi:hypothetical protein
MSQFRLEAAVAASLSQFIPDAPGESHTTDNRPLRGALFGRCRNRSRTATDAKHEHEQDVRAPLEGARPRAYSSATKNADLFTSTSENCEVRKR